ncbi:alpha/beta fold hydrolase [Hoeflea sp. CAU 1731]
MHQESSQISRDSLDLTNQFIEPASPVERKVLAIWEECLEIENLGMDDDFFDLGGNSTNGAKLVTRINETFAASFKTGALVHFCTPAAMVNLIGSDDNLLLPSNVIAVRQTGNRPPLFLVHGAAGIVFPTPQFMAGFHNDQPVYAFQIRGFDGRDEPLDTVEEIAADYVDSMLQVSPDGPWFIAGYCAGSWIVVEMARRLETMGKKAGRLVLIDPGIQRGKMREQFDMHYSTPARIIKPVLSTSALERLNFHSNWARFRCFLATGHWIDYRDIGAFDVPAVRHWILSRKKNHMKRAVRIGQLKKKFESESVEDEAVTLESTTDIILASAKLKHAFYSYANSTPLNQPVDIIVSKSREKELENRNHPLNTILPRQNRIISGENHTDAVASASPVNARIIQQMMDESNVADPQQSLTTVA